MKTYSIVMVVMLTLLCAGMVAAAPTVSFESLSPASGTNSTNATVRLYMNVTNADQETVLCNVSFFGGSIPLNYVDRNLTNATSYNSTFSLTSGGNARYSYNATCADSASSASSATRTYTWDNTGPSITPSVTVITEAAAGVAGTYRLQATITDALVGLKAYNITVDGTNYALTAMGSDVYGINFTTWMPGDTHTYTFNAWDNLDTSSTSSGSYSVTYRYGCSNLVTIVFAALGLLSLVGIVLGAGWFMNNFGDGSLLMPLVLSVITLGIVVMLGYVVVQNLSAAFC